MKIAYRQGIISFQTDGLGGPQFLLPSATPGFIDFDVSPTPTTVAFAHGASNYLVTFDVDSTPGWGPITGGVTSYLYWDIDLLTGGITRGITTLMPVAAPTAPTTPDIDQHWFDLTTTTMKVWNGTKWLSKIRLFAGYVPFGVVGSLVHYGANSQVGLTEAVDAGYILTDALLQPLRNGKGEFLTSDTRVLVQSSSGTSGVLTKAPVGFMPVKATENIPAFSLVTFTGADQVGLASGDPALVVPKTPIGIVVDDLSTGEVGMMTQYGEISSDTFPSWFATNIGKPVYCSPTGELTPVRPSGLLAYRVGTVKSPTSLLFQIDAETLVAMVEVGTSNVVINGQAPIVVPAPSINGLGEQVWTVTLPAATVTEAGHMTAAHVTTLETHTTEIADLELTKSDVGHGHVIADVSGLQTALNNKSDVGHTHIIANVTGLQVELDGKAPLVHGHMIADVAGLQTALDGKADLVHLHEIADVNLLQAALDSKSNVGHGHTITDVADFSEAIDDRVSNLLVAGSNITLTYDDTANTLTIDSAGGSSAVDTSYVAVGTGASIAGDPNLKYNQTNYSFYVNQRLAGEGPQPTHPDSEVFIATAGPGGNARLEMYANGSPEASSDITFYAGTANVTNSHGGDFTIYAGNGSTDDQGRRGGHFNMWAGDGDRGGGFTITAGAGIHGNGGEATLQAGRSESATSLGGSLYLQAGWNTADQNNGGRIVLSHTHFTAPRMEINPYGAISLKSNFSAADNFGAPGEVLTSAGANAQPYWSAPAGGSTSVALDEIAVGTGTGVTSFSGFRYEVTSNSLYVNVPNVVNADAEIIMRSGSNTSASTGESEFLMATAPDGGASDIYLQAGANTLETNADGGNITISGGRGNSADGQGGSVIVEGGNAFIGGDANMFAGQGGSDPGARGGEAVIQAGNGYEGGWTHVIAGNGAAGAPGSTGGTVRISAGSVTGNDQSSGSIQLRTSATTRLAITGTGEWQLGGLAGNLGQVLTSQGTNSAPVWADPPAGLPAPTDVGYVIAGISGQYEVLSSAGFPAIPVMGNGGFPQLLTGGSNGEVLTYNDSFSPPYTWQTPAGGQIGGAIRVRNTANQHTSDGTMIATWSEVSEYLQGSPWTWNATFGELEFNGAENTVWEITLTLELSGVTWPTGAEIIGAVNLVPGSLGGGNVQPGNAATASWYHPVAVPTNSQKRFSATYVVFGGVGPISYQVGAAYETPGAVATAANAAVMITAKYLGQSNAV